MENGSGSVERLQFILDVEGAEDVLRVADGQVRRIGVIRRTVFVCGNDVRELILVVLCKTERSGFCRSRFQIVKVAVLFLVIGKARSHVVQNFLRELLGLFVGQVLADPFGVERGFVHAHETDRGKMVVEGSEVMLGVRVEAFV